jgi:hypothetical protein
MKTRCCCILLGLVLGILIGSGWNKEDPTDHSEGGMVDTRMKHASGSHDFSGEAASRRSKSSRATPQESAAEEFHLGQIERQIQTLRVNSKLEMNELAIRLELSDNQLGHLERLVAEKLRHYHLELQSQETPSGIGWRLDMLDLTSNLIDEVLTDSQRKDFHLLKEREREAKIEAAALVELSKLSTLTLDEDQKQRAFEILLEKEQEDFKQSPKIPGYRGIYEENVPQAKKKLEETLERMNGILDADQLTIYRQRLEIKLGLLMTI